MRKQFAAVLVALTVLGIAPLSAQPGGNEELVDRVVAVVGDTTLLYSEVVLELEQLEAAGQTVPTDPAARDALVRQLVGRRVDDLLLLEAARSTDITVSEGDVADAVERQMQEVLQQFNGSQAEFGRALAASGRSVEEYRASLVKNFIDRAMVQRYIARRMDQMARPPVTEAQMREFFDTQRTRLGTRPASVSFQQVIVKAVPSDSAKARARRTAEQVLTELRAPGGDFTVLARRYSQDGSAQQGGDLGWFREGQMVRPFEAMVYALRPGDVSPVVETEFGYHIIRLDKIRGPERSARHILIRPEVTADDVASARQRADSIAQALRGGAAAGPLAIATQTPEDARNNRSVPVTRLPPAYAAVGTAQVGEVVGPLEVAGAGGQQSFAVARVTERQAEGAYELADVREQVRERLQEDLMSRLIVEELRRTTHIAISL